ncbi:MAG TPA: hypothetical protein VFR71_07600, partial [Methyloceanibacter sp.]|nr:hypothetical protein [Methyloceanibacter sp.]
RLNLYNAAENWLTRQFTIEYCALFDGLLPALDRLPLGGTSNHFRASALRWLSVGRLQRDRGRRSRHRARAQRLSLSGASLDHLRRGAGAGDVLAEATHALAEGLRADLARAYARSAPAVARVGPRGFLAFQVVVGGTILSALVHPWFYVLASFEFGIGKLMAQPESVFGWPFWLIAWFDLSAGYLASMGLGFLAVQCRGYRALLWHIPLMPLYWPPHLGRRPIGRYGNS